MMNKKYLTVKEFAEAANISQQAVYKQLSNRLKPFVKKQGKHKLIAYDALKEFYFPNDGFSTQVEQVEQPNSTADFQDFQPKVEQVEQPNSTLDPENEIQNILKDQVNELKTQLEQVIQREQEEKEFLKEQIRQKDKLIDSLTENLKIAQQLAAVDKKKLLELEAKKEEGQEDDTEAKPEDQEKPPEKKGFFARLFGL